MEPEGGKPGEEPARSSPERSDHRDRSGSRRRSYERDHSQGDRSDVPPPSSDDKWPPDGAFRGARPSRGRSPSPYAPSRRSHHEQGPPSFDRRGPPDGPPRYRDGPPREYHDFRGRPPMRGRGGFQSHEGYSGPHRYPNYLEHIPPEDNPVANRTLFVGNIDCEMSSEDIRQIFERFGVVEEIRLKQSPNGSSNPFAFVKFFNLNQAHVAKTEMSGKFIGRFRCKIGYGRVTATNCVWVGGLGPWVPKQELEKEFSRFGRILRVVWPAGSDYAFIVYDTVDSAKNAVEIMRGFTFRGTDVRLRTDFGDVNQIDVQTAPRRAHRRTGTSSSPTGRSGSHGRGHGRRHRRRTGGSSSGSESGSSSGSASRSPVSRKNRNKKGTGRTKRRHASSSSSSGSGRSSDRSNNGGRSTSKRVRSFPMGNIDDAGTVVDLARCLPVVWTGQLVLKKQMFPTRMLLVSGRSSLVDELLLLDETTAIGLESTDERKLKITQRLRMDEPKLEEVRRRIAMSGADGWSILLAMPMPVGIGEDGKQSTSLGELVTYLREKKAAGVLSLPPDCKSGEEQGLLHIFPPCKFVHQYLLARSPKLKMDYTTSDYIFIFLVRVKT